MRMGTETYHHLKKVINTRFGLDATAVGDEGGFAPNILNNKDGKFFLQTVLVYSLTNINLCILIRNTSYTTHSPRNRSVEKLNHDQNVEINLLKKNVWISRQKKKNSPPAIIK